MESLLLLLLVAIFAEYEVGPTIRPEDGSDGGSLDSIKERVGTVTTGRGGGMQFGVNVGLGLGFYWD